LLSPITRIGLTEPVALAVAAPLTHVAVYETIADVPVLDGV
jgi:hypothetical protein